MLVLTPLPCFDLRRDVPSHRSSHRFYNHIGVRSNHSVLKTTQNNGELPETQKRSLVTR